MSEPDSRFDASRIAHLAEPVRRYFTHALGPDAWLSSAFGLRMQGRIKVGTWLPFDATWRGDGRSFEWRARAGWLRPLHVVDRYESGHASMDVRLLGRLRMVHATGEDTIRSAAGRAAVEAAMWAPDSLLPSRGVIWRAESDEHIVASWDVPPERPEIHITLDPDGAVGSASLMRWDDGTHGRHGYIPCGGSVQAERRFGDRVLASEITVGWWFDTPQWDPFFEAKILEASPLR